jgi:AraC-like DNA-binding protein
MGLAEEFLSSGTLTVEEVAVRLGYSEAASFTRAFARSRGVPPGEYRRRAIAAGSQPARSSANPSSLDVTGW